MLQLCTVAGSNRFESAWVGSARSAWDGSGQLIVGSDCESKSGIYLKHKGGSCDCGSAEYEPEPICGLYRERSGHGSGGSGCRLLARISSEARDNDDSIKARQ